MENFVLIAKINKKSKLALKQMYNFLKEEKIEYKEELEDKWIGIRQPEYDASIAFYLKESDRAKVEKFIEELDSATIMSEENDELREYTQKEQDEDEKELKRYRKRQKLLQKIMIYGVFLIVIFWIILAIIVNF